MHVFSMLPSRLGGLDMLLPLFMEMKRTRSDMRISVLFFEDRVYNDLLRDPFLSKEFSRIVDTTRRLHNLEKAKTNYISAAPAMGGVLMDVLRSERPILLHSNGINSPSMKLLHAAVKAKGGSSYQHFKGMALTIDRVSKAHVKKGSDGDGFICFSEHDIKFLGKVGYKRLIPVGYPRLYSAWIQRVRDVAQEFLAKEYRGLGFSHPQPCIAFFLGSTVTNVYSAQELEQWLRDVLNTAQDMLPHMPVLVKPHPIEKPHVLKMIRDMAGTHPLARCTFLHPCVLAAGARLVVSHHSSTIIDSMALGVPTIQYQELTPHWLKSHPEGSSFLKLGPLWARNRTELVGCMEKALSEKYVVPDIRPVLGHKENLKVLLKGRQ